MRCGDGVCECGGGVVCECGVFLEEMCDDVF